MSFTVDSELAAELQTLLSNLEAGRFLTIASITVLVYEYVITLSEEIELMWDSNWSITKCLFLLNRYSVFVDPFIYISFTKLPIESKRVSCITTLKWFAWTSTLGILFAQIILKLRTWAIWGKHTTITLLLAAEFTIAFVTSVLFTQRYLDGIESIPGTLPGGGCIFTFGNRLIFVIFISILLSETTVVTLLVIKAAQYFRHENTLLMNRVLRDGLLHFLCILLTSIANVITILIAPIEIHAMLVVFQRVMHSILCNRVLLNIRGVLFRRRDHDHESTLQPLDSSFSATYFPTTNSHCSTCNNQLNNK